METFLNEGHYFSAIFAENRMFSKILDFFIEFFFRFFALGQSDRSDFENHVSRERLDHFHQFSAWWKVFMKGKHPNSEKNLIWPNLPKFGPFGPKMGPFGPKIWIWPNMVMLYTIRLQMSCKLQILENFGKICHFAPQMGPKITKNARK